MEVLINGLEDHLVRAVIVSAVLALLITGAVWIIWLRGRGWVDRGRTSLAAGRHTSLFSGMDEPPPGRAGGSASPREESRSGGEEQLASKLVREAATRAAALRDAWDRSYREARGTEAAPIGPPSESGADLRSVLEEVLREQRETNALLRQLVDRLAPPKN